MKAGERLETVIINKVAKEIEGMLNTDVDSLFNCEDCNHRLSKKIARSLSKNFLFVMR